MRLTHFVTVHQLCTGYVAHDKPVYFYTPEELAEDTARVYEAYGTAVGAFGAAAARIFEQKEVLKTQVVDEALAQLDDELLELGFALDGAPLTDRLAMVTQSAQVEEAI